MFDQLPLPAPPYPALPPVTVTDRALLRFDEEMDARLVDFDVRFYVRRIHPLIQMRRHRNQPPRKPR